MKIGHIVIHISKLEENIKFYDKLLSLIGYEKIDFKTESNRVFVNSEGTFLDIRQTSEDKLIYYKQPEGLNHIGFVSPTSESVINAYEAMRNDGYNTSNLKEYNDGVAFFVQDNDGLSIEISHYK